MTDSKTIGPKTIAIVDYGAGNLNSVKKAFDHLGVDVVVATQPEAIGAAGQNYSSRSRPFLRAERPRQHGPARSRAARRQSRKAAPRNLSRNAVAVRRQRRSSRFRGSRNSSRPLPAFPALGQITARRMELSRCSEWYAPVARSCARFFRLLHPLFSGSGRRRNLSHNRLRTAVLRSRRTRKHFRSSIPPREILRRWASHSQELLRVQLMRSNC